jgi:hypothetical protein
MFSLVVDIYALELAESSKFTAMFSSNNQQDSEKDAKNIIHKGKKRQKNADNGKDSKENDLNEWVSMDGNGSSSGNNSGNIDVEMMNLTLNLEVPCMFNFF